MKSFLGYRFDARRRRARKARQSPSRARTLGTGVMQLEQRLVLSAVGMPIELPNEMFAAAEIQLAVQTPAFSPQAELAVKSSVRVSPQRGPGSIAANEHASIKPQLEPPMLQAGFPSPMFSTGLRVRPHGVPSNGHARIDVGHRPELPPAARDLIGHLTHLWERVRRPASRWVETEQIGAPVADVTEVILPLGGGEPDGAGPEANLGTQDNGTTSPAGSFSFEFTTPSLDTGGSGLGGNVQLTFSLGEEGGPADDNSATLPPDGPGSPASPADGPGGIPGVDPDSFAQPLPSQLGFGPIDDSPDDSEPASAERIESPATDSQLPPTTAALDAAIAVMFGTDEQSHLFVDDFVEAFQQLPVDSAEAFESDGMALEASEAGSELKGKLEALPVDQALDEGDLIDDALAVAPAEVALAPVDADSVSLDMVGLFGELAPGLPRGLSQLIAGVAAADLALAQQSLDSLLAMMEQLNEASGLLAEASFAACLLTTLAAAVTAYEINRRKIHRERKGDGAECEEDALPPDALLMMASLS